MKGFFKLCKGYKEKNMEEENQKKHNQKLEDILQMTAD